MKILSPTRVFALVLLFCSTLGFASILNAQTVADYHYQGQLEFDVSRGYIKAQWQIQVLNKDINRINFLIRDSLKNIKADGPAVREQQISQKEQLPGFWSIEVTIEPQAVNRIINLSYDGVLLPEPMENKINSINADSIELNVDSFWHPIDANFNKLLTVDLDITIDKSWQGVSSGEFTKTERGLHLSNKHPAIDIPFALSNRFSVTQKSGFSIYDLRDSNEGVDAMAETAKFCKTFLDKHYGKSETLPTSKFLLTTRKSSGYSRNNYIALTDIAGTKAVPLTKFICHELAHFWSSGGKFDTVDNWLNEAFAEYIGAMAVRERFGVNEYNELMSSFSKKIESKNLPPVWQPGDTERKSDDVQYRKGSLVLAKLEKVMGEDKFQSFVTEYMVNRISTTPELLDTLERIAGEDARKKFTTFLAD